MLLFGFPLLLLSINLNLILEISVMTISLCPRPESLARISRYLSIYACIISCACGEGK